MCLIQTLFLLRAGSAIFQHILAGTRRGAVYLFWFLREGTDNALCQPSEIGRTSGRTVRQTQYDPRGVTTARSAYSQIMFVCLVRCLLQESLTSKRGVRTQKQTWSPLHSIKGGDTRATMMNLLHYLVTVVNFKVLLWKLWTFQTYQKKDVSAHLRWFADEVVDGLLVSNSQEDV